LPDRIRLLLVDDQILSRGVLRNRLEREQDLEVVAELGRGDDVVAAAKRLRADIALVDGSTSGLDALAVTTTLRTAMPECRVLVLTTYGRPGYLRRGLDAGAKGVDADLAAETLRYTDCPLTEWEADTLRAARDGGSVAALAKTLALSEHVVRNRLSSAIDKTGARTRAEAVLIAEQNGWLAD